MIEYKRKEILSQARHERGVSMFGKQEQRERSRLIANKIKLERQRRNISQVGLAEKMGVKQPYISNIEQAKAIPSEKALIRIARALDLEEDYFIRYINNLAEEQYREEKEGETNNPRDIIENLIDTLNVKYSRNTLIPLSHAMAGEQTNRVVELEFPVGAGESFTTDHVVAEYQLPWSITHGATHMIRVHGTSMEPVIMEGDMVLVVQTSRLEKDGQLAVVNVDNHANMVKFVYTDGDNVGFGRNRNELEWRHRDEVKIQGLVVGRISKYNVIQEFERRAEE